MQSLKPRELSTKAAAGSWRGGGSAGGHRPCQLVWSGLQGKQVTQAGGLGSYAGPQKNRAWSAPCLGLITHSGCSLLLGVTSVFYADDEETWHYLARIRPYSVSQSRKAVVVMVGVMVAISDADNP